MPSLPLGQNLVPQRKCLHLSIGCSATGHTVRSQCHCQPGSGGASPCGHTKPQPPQARHKQPYGHSEERKVVKCGVRLGREGPQQGS
uniref:Uncharacterized protein n=1 Tax=Arundo donax TaxID=35708 RepID=A0A0A9CLD7_ARUDO